ncbi:hypothetical protein RFI_00501, partial [Reticulomyxa filosa]
KKKKQRIQFCMSIFCFLHLYYSFTPVHLISSRNNVMSQDSPVSKLKLEVYQKGDNHDNTKWSETVVKLNSSKQEEWSEYNEELVCANDRQQKIVLTFRIRVRDSCKDKGPLPGEVYFDLTYDLNQDLKELQKELSNIYVYTCVHMFVCSLFTFIHICVYMYIYTYKCITNIFIISNCICVYHNFSKI